ncbi:MAG: hypothetical protein IJ196_00640 [Prevotella sp.]|nr:hypothetical protein [Prevotella sp.]
MPHTPMMYGTYMCLVLSIPTACTGRYAKRCRREGWDGCWRLEAFEPEKRLVLGLQTCR